MLKYVKILDRCKIVHILAPDNNKKHIYHDNTNNKTKQQKT
jgi:ketol-acid reductoisomerase